MSILAHRAVSNGGANAFNTFTMRTLGSWVQQLGPLRAEVTHRLSDLSKKVAALGVISPRRLVPGMVHDQETEMLWVPGGR